MRTTITLPDAIIEETRKETGVSSISEAIAKGLNEYLEARKRLKLLNHLFETPVPHKRAKIKRDRKR